MTDAGVRDARVIMVRGIGRRLWATTMTVLVFAAAVFFSEEMGGYVTEGLRLAVTRVIPTAVPFMLISDIFKAAVSADDVPLIGALGGLFGLSRASATALLPGNACGFPLGGKLTSELYQDGVIAKNEAERLLAYSSNPSPSFVIAAVGGGMLGDAKLGIILLICIYLATLLSAQFFRRSRSNISYLPQNTRQKYDFVLSVRSAGTACLSLTGFIVTFSVIGGVIEGYVQYEPLKALLIALTEVTGASNYFALEAGLSLPLALAAVAFSLGFGGLSVLFQTASFAKEVGLSMKKYFVIKLVEGIFSAGLALIGYRMFFHQGR